MHLVCPHCQSPVEVADENMSDVVLCSSCGTSFGIGKGIQSTIAAPQGAGSLGKFDLLAGVGSGAFGTVYKARDRELDRTVAIKVPRTGSFSNQDEQERFLREARSVAQLRHPSIVSVYDVGQSDGTPYLVSEFVEGTTLADYLTGAKPSARETSELVARVADALQYAHGQGVVHRDVKPSNIMVGTDGVPHVMDFGLARRDAGEATMTTDGQVLGTPAYMSPEQAKGESHSVDGRGDVYSLGVVLYQMLTGELPFRGNTRMLLHQVLHDEPRPPRKINDLIPRDLETVCLKAMAKEAGRRYQTAGDLADDLRRFLNGEPVQARPVGNVERWWRWSKRNPKVATLSAAFVVLLLGSLIGGYWLAYREAISAENERTAKTAAQIAEGREKERAEEAGKRQREAEQAREEERKAKLAYETANHRAEEALQASERSDNEGRRRLVRLLTASGVRTMDDGDWFGALPWFTEALRIDQGDAAREEPHRRRIGAILHHAPRLAGQWNVPGTAIDGDFSPDSLTFVVCGAKIALFRNSETGEQLGQPLKHGDYIRRVVFSPNGQTVGTASDDGTARIWNAHTGAPVTPPLQHGKRVAWLAFSSDSGRVVTASHDRTARVWNASTGAPLTPPLEHDAEINWAEFTRDGGHLFTAGLNTATRQSTAVVKWDAATGQKVDFTIDERETLYTVALSSDGGRLVTGSQSGWVRIWDAADGKLLLPALRHEGNVVRVAFSQEGGLLSASGGSVRVWDPKSGDLRMESRLAGGRIAWRSDGGQVAAISKAGVRVVDGFDGVAIGPLLPLLGSPMFLRFNNRGDRLLVGSQSGQVRLWDMTQRFPARPPPELSASGSVLLAANHDGSRLAFTGFVAVNHQGPRKRCVVLWDTGERRMVAPPLFRDAASRSAAFSPDGGRLAVGYHDNQVQIWNLEDGAPLGDPLSNTAPVWIEFSVDGRTVLIAQGTGEVRLWDAMNRQPRSPVLQSDFLPLLSPDGRYVATFENPGEADQGIPTTTMREAATGLPLSSRQAGWIMAFSPDGERYLFSRFSSGHMASVLETRTGLPVSGPDFGGSPHAGQFSPDGRRVVTVHMSATARIFSAVDKADANFKTVTLSPDNMPSFAAFDSAGRRVATISEAGHARVWEVAGGQPLTPEMGVDTFGGIAVFSSDGQRLLTLTGTNYRGWDAATGEPLSPAVRLCAHWTPFMRHKTPSTVTRAVTGAGLPDVPSDGRTIQHVQLVSSVLALRTADESGGLLAVQEGTAADDWIRLSLVAARTNVAYDEDDASFAAALRTARLRGAQEQETVGSQKIALSLLDALIAAGPDDVASYARRGAIRMRLREWQKAVDDFDICLSRGDEAAPLILEQRAFAFHQLQRFRDAANDFSRLLEIETDPGRRGGLHGRRGHVFATLGDWEAASRDFQQACELAPTLTWWNSLVMSQIASGNTAAYHRTCSELLARFRESQDPLSLNEAAWSTVLDASSIIDRAQPLEMSRRALEKAGSRTMSWVGTLGAVLYRAGEFEEADRMLTEAIALAAKERRPASPEDWLFLAMTRQRLEKPAEARNALDTALGLPDMTAIAATQAQSLPDPQWMLSVQRRALLHEARSLLQRQP